MRHVGAVLKILGITLFLASPQGWAATPASTATIDFQGYLTNGSDAPVETAGTPLSVTFSIYDALTGGNKLWSETQSIQVSEGAFFVSLGSTSQTSSDNLISSLRGHPDLYLEMQVSGDTPMSPRFPMTGAIAALMAHHLQTPQGSIGVSPSGTTSGLWIDIPNTTSGSSNWLITSFGGSSSNLIGFGGDSTGAALIQSSGDLVIAPNMGTTLDSNAPSAMTVSQATGVEISVPLKVSNYPVTANDFVYSSPVTRSIQIAGSTCVGSNATPDSSVVSACKLGNTSVASHAVWQVQSLPIGATFNNFSVIGAVSLTTLSLTCQLMETNGTTDVSLGKVIISSISQSETPVAINAGYNMNDGYFVTCDLPLGGTATVNLIRITYSTTNPL